MSIFKEFFHKLFAAGSDDIGDDPQKRWEENIGDEKENPEKRETTITDKRKLYSLLNKEIFQSTVEDVYSIYKSDTDIKSYLKECDELVDQLIDLALPKDYVEDFGPGLKSEVMGLIIKIIKNYEALDKDKKEAPEALSSLVNLSLSNAESNLYRLLELLDECLDCYQEQQEDMIPYIKQQLDLDPNEFLNDIIPIVILFRKFQITAYNDITTDMKKDLLDKVNSFNSKYSSTLDALLRNLGDYIYTLKNRGKGSASVIGKK